MRTQKYRSLLVCVFCFIPALVLAQRYTVTDLGALEPTGINSWAQVVGNYNGHASMWTRGQGKRDLGVLAGGTFSRAAAINDLGVVTGTADGNGTVISFDTNFPNEECSDLVQPFIWTVRNGMRGLGTTGQHWDMTAWCDVPFYASDINLSNQVVGYTAKYASYTYALLWTGVGGITLFGDGWPTTAAYGMSNKGQIVGQDATMWLFGNGSGHASSWKNGAQTDLGTLGGGADVLEYSSGANGVNDLGQVVGWSNTVPYFSNGPIHAVLWTENGAIRDLGTLPDDTDSIASKINLFGQVIGYSTNGFPFLSRAFVWSQRSGMRDLNMLIPVNSGWVLQAATDINVWGQIVGSGTHNGQPHGYLLTPLNPFQVF